MSEAGRAPLGVIEVSGDDAGTFLRAQLTNDVLRLGSDRHFLAAWCDAKGRAILLAQVLEQADDGYLLILPSTLIDAVLQRLRMYVLRARVTLTDVSDRYRLAGLLGPDLPSANRLTALDDARLLGLPPTADGAARALWIGTADAHPPENSLNTEAPEWALACIDAGVPELVGATRGLFVPQMLNLHWLLAIDFDKGCYPGQEVIARLHYRGRLTRRLHRLAWRGDEPAPGDEIIDDADRVQGTVVSAAPTAGDGGHGRLLAVLRIDGAGSALRAGSTALELLDLPYATPD